MREIKFRGKRSFDGSWTFWTVCQSPIPVKEKTIGQFTGLKDMNGVEIYEGDILTGGILVEWHEILASFCLRRNGWAYPHFFREALEANEVSVIGNIYETPKLLESAK